MRVATSDGFHDSFPRISSPKRVVRSVVFLVNDSVSRSDSLPPSAPRSRSRIANENESFRLTSAPVPRSRSRMANASRVVQTHFRPRPSFSFANGECQPSRSDSLPPSVPRSRSRSRMPAESVRLTSSLVHNIQTNHEITKSRFTIVQWCKWLSINTTLTKLISAEERFVFGMGILLPGPRTRTSARAHFI